MDDEELITLEDQLINLEELADYVRQDQLHGKGTPEAGDLEYVYNYSHAVYVLGLEAIQLLFFLPIPQLL